MPFIRNLWYVAAWTSELAYGQVIGRRIIGDPVALYRKTDGQAVAVADRCAHRHAALSLGRVEGDDLRCMYHGLKFSADGKCVHIPGTDALPPNTNIRAYPVAERDGWIWVWMGDPARADLSLLAAAWGPEHPDFAMRTGAIDYEAHYELINDNLCDLSHLDFTHETTLAASTGGGWSLADAKVGILENGLSVERWFTDRLFQPRNPDRADQRNTYRYTLPGLFIMTTEFFRAGTAAACSFGAPDAVPFMRRVEQQAVTPIDEHRTRYLFGTGIGRDIPEKLHDAIFAVVNVAFGEDKAMIEAQQKIWDVTPAELPKAFIPQDKAPAIMRRLITKRLKDEAEHKLPIH